MYFERPLARFAPAVLGPALVAGLWVMDFQPSVTSPFLPLLAAVLLAAWMGGAWSCLLAATAGLTWSIPGYIFQASANSAAFSHRVIQAGLFLTVAAGLTALLRHLENQISEAHLTESQVDVPIVCTDTDGRITFSNRAASSLFDLSESGLRRQSIHSLLGCPQDARHALGCALQPALDGNESVLNRNTTISLRSGSQRRISYSAHPLRDGERLVGAVLSLQDETSTAGKLDEICAREEQHRSLINGLRQAVLLTDSYGYITVANTSMARLLGYSEASQIPPLRVVDLLASQDRASFQEAWRSLEPGKPRTLQVLVVASGTRFPVELEITVQGRREEASAVVSMQPVSPKVEAPTPGPRPLHDAVTSAGLALNDGGSFQAALPAILRTVGELGRWDTVLFWRADGTDRTLRCVHSWQVPDIRLPHFAAINADVALPQNIDLPGKVWATGSTIWVADIRTERTVLRAAAAGQDGLRTAAAVPVAGARGVYGVLEVLSRQVCEPDSTVETSLSDLGRYLGRAIDRQDAERALAHRAMHDGLTGLPNRQLFHDRLDRALSVARTGGTSLAVVLMDLNRFKQVNDTYGHHAGDALLREVAQRVGGCLRDSDTLARLGGDEFALLLPGASESTGKVVAERILGRVNQPIEVEGNMLSVGGSLGIAVCPDHGSDAGILLQHADAAMYSIKRGGGGYLVYDESCDALLESAS